MVEKFKLYLIPALMEYTKNYIYYIHDIVNNLGFIVDPGEYSPVIKFLEQDYCWLPKPSYILNTHHHWDHVNGNLELKKRYNLKIIGAQMDAYRIPGIDQSLEYEQMLSIGIFNFRIIHTPGHTNNHIAFYCAENQILFCGDTMFSAGCGGIFEGTSSDMFISFEKFFSLPDQTIVCPAHEYTASNLKFALYLENDNKFIKDYLHGIILKLKNNHPSLPSTIGIEKKINPFLRYGDLQLRKVLNIDQDMSNLNTFNKIMGYKENYYRK